MKLEIRKVAEIDLKRIFDFRSSYIDISYEDFVQKAKFNDGLWLAAYDENILIGYCLGIKCKNNPYYIAIDEIATNVSSDLKYKRKGIGTLLIKLFEEQVWKQDFKTIGFGCSDDFKVEKFYLKNEFIPIEVVVYRKGVELERVKISDYESGKAVQAELRSKYNAKEGNFVFEKYYNDRNKKKS